MTTQNVVSWTPPTTNTDGSAIAAGEITGYTVGVRPAAGTVGVYPVTKQVAPSVLTLDLKTLGLAPGSYFVSVETNSANNSSWDPEIGFTIPQPTPNPPGNFSLA